MTGYVALICMCVCLHGGRRNRNSCKRNKHLLELLVSCFSLCNLLHSSSVFFSPPMCKDEGWPPHFSPLIHCLACACNVNSVMQHNVAQLSRNMHRVTSVSCPRRGGWSSCVLWPTKIEAYRLLTHQRPQSHTWLTLVWPWGAVVERVIFYTLKLYLQKWLLKPIRSLHDKVRVRVNACTYEESMSTFGWSKSSCFHLSNVKLLHSILINNCHRETYKREETDTGRHDGLVLFEFSIFKGFTAA